MSLEKDLNAVNISIDRMMTKIIVDLMNRDNIYLGTLRIEPELNMISDYYGNKPVVSVNALRKTIEEKRPPLRANTMYHFLSVEYKS